MDLSLQASGSSYLGPKKVCKIMALNLYKESKRQLLCILAGFIVVSRAPVDDGQRTAAQTLCHAQPVSMQGPEGPKYPNVSI